MNSRAARAYFHPGSQSADLAAYARRLPAEAQAIETAAVQDERIPLGMIVVVMDGGGEEG